MCYTIINLIDGTNDKKYFQKIKAESKKNFFKFRNNKIQFSHYIQNVCPC